MRASSANPVRLTDELHGLGVRKGDLLMVHASLRRLGLARSQGVEDGAARLLYALDEAVGPQGTLLMLLGTEYEYDWVNFKPVPERAALLAGTPPFDFANAPVLPEVGYFAEAFRQAPGTIVSGNPSGRFGARGRLAEELVRDQPWNDYYGPGSPLDELTQRGGRVLRLGADPGTVTALHFAEHLAKVPNKRRTRWDYVLEGKSGPEHVFIDNLNDFDGIVSWEGDDYFELILKEYLALGRGQRGRVGAADSELLDAADLVRFGAEWMERHLTGAAPP